MFHIRNDDTGHSVDGIVYGPWSPPCQCHQAYPHHVHQGHIHNHLHQGIFSQVPFRGNKKL